MIQRIATGRPPAHVAAEMGVSRACAYKWWGRWRADGEAGLVDRPSHARSHPKRTPACVETRIRISRHLSRSGPVAIGAHLSVPASTVGRVLRRHRTPPLAVCDPVTGQVIRASRRSANRYEHDHPGSLVHVDVKKLGRIPDGGGWRAWGRAATVEHRHKKVPVGYDYVHAAVDDHSRLAYAEILGDEKGATCAGFLTRAAAFTPATASPSVVQHVPDPIRAGERHLGDPGRIHALRREQHHLRPRQVTTEPLDRRTMRNSRLPSSLLITRTCTRCTISHLLRGRQDQTTRDSSPRVQSARANVHGRGTSYFAL